MAIEVKTTPKKDNRVSYACLEIGDCFKDEAEYVCIKVNSTHCLFMDDSKHWHFAPQERDSKVTPVKATLTIEE